MSKAVVPDEMPPLPEGFNAWARSTRRRGGMFHAHTLGMTACRSLLLERHSSEQATGIEVMQYWGVCPRCLAKAKARPRTA